MLNQALRLVLKHPRACVAAVFIVVLAALIGGSAWVVGQRPKPPDIVMLPANYVIPPQKAPIPDRWIPLSWGWLWRFKEAVLGKAKVVSMELTRFDLDSVV